VGSPTDEVRRTTATVNKEQPVVAIYLHVHGERLSKGFLMRTITSQTRNAWLSGDYTGSNRAMMRATIAKLSIITVPHKTQVYASTVWGQNHKPRELPNIKSINWSRTLDNDAASMTMELFNTNPLPLGTAPARNEDFDQPGFYTYNHGKTSWSTTRWNQTPTGWHDFLVPDRVIRTYEGYGFDPDLIPEKDPHMYLSGVWLIDTVEYTHDGLITVTCRDLGRLLLDQILYVPVVPFKHYPLHFQTFHPVADPDEVTTGEGGGSKWIRPAFSDSSTTPYVGRNGSVYGHRGTDAFDDSNATYWLSTGNAQPNADYSYEWIEGKIKSATVSAVKFRTWGGPYRVYVSIFANGAWRGDQKIPYNPDDPVAAPNGSDIKFVTAFSVGDGVLKQHKLNKSYDNVTKVRLTFHHLYNSGIGPYVYRAGCRNFKVGIGGGESWSEVTPGGSHQEGNYGDYTDIVKRLLAYAGFYWPRGTNRAFRKQSDGNYVQALPPGNDPLLKAGRIWGDLQDTGTAGIWPGGDLTVDIWDKKPIMDGINYIRDIVGFVFFVDETGGAVWRMPNVWKIGNWVGDAGTDTGRTDQVITLDERTVLIGLTATLDSRNVREKIFVANVSGKIGSVVKGFNPYRSGLRRVGGWTDQHFQTNQECEVMADLIATRQMYTYRTDKVTIAGNPAIQIDDQVRIYERTTNEGYYHYISGIECDWDLESGRWTYSLSTHWLGSSTYGDWVIQPDTLQPATQNFLDSLIPGGL
jgi:hypothetical protein